MSTLELQNVSFSYEKNKKVLQDINYSFDAGKVYAIVGRSGAGKTTLLSLLSGLTSPDEGKILANGEDILKHDRCEFRSRTVGIIFQSFNLLPHLTARENVELSMRASGKKIADIKGRSRSLLESVGLDDSLADRRILKLSGGEQQRVAIARALSYDPDIILADEPTGNLDLGTQEEIMDIFSRLAHEEGKCVILVSHSPDVARAADEVYELAPLTRRKKSDKRRS
ncbi:MAG: ABC transporter ATP-binding protein [Clostridium sp.]|jgi:putative ABC transport system ATP-binding protein|nr:ABC transporter ATP-binding protein [Clostridium sp.]